MKTYEQDKYWTELIHICKASCLSDYESYRIKRIATSSFCYNVEKQRRTLCNDAKETNCSVGNTVTG